MLAPADALGAAQLQLSGLTVALHLAAARATVEVFAPGGQLLLVATATRLQPGGVRAAWTTATGRARRALVAIGSGAPDEPLPRIRFTHGRRQVRGLITRLGPFWVAEAAGRRLRLVVDDGRVATTAKSRRLPGPVALRQSPHPHHHPFRPHQETL